MRSGASESSSSRGHGGRGHVVAEHVDEVERVRRGRHVREVERGDAAHVVEDAGQIARQRLELVGLERDVREGGGVPHVVRGQAHGSGV